jgi:hypothetical protein
MTISMKISFHNRQHGGVLVVTLNTCLCIGIVLGSYLSFASGRCKNQPTTNNSVPGKIADQTVYSKQRTNADGSTFLANLSYSGTNKSCICATGVLRLQTSSR